MRRRDLLAVGPAVAVAATSRGPIYLCLHEQTSAGSDFRTAMEGYAQAGVRAVELTLPKVQEFARKESAAVARRLLADQIPADVYRRLEAEEALAVQRLEAELASLPEDPPAVDIAPILSVLGSITWDDLSWEAWRQVLTLVVNRILLLGRSQFRIEWQPAADILRRAVDRVSRSGSRMLG